ncbi:MAG: LamG-like jellyroll fold domain-containing protein, partial [Pseudomonadales bacterium]
YAERQTTPAMSFEFICRRNQDVGSITSGIFASTVSASVSHQRWYVIVDENSAVQLRYGDGSSSYAVPPSSSNVIVTHEIHHVVITIDNSSTTGAVNYYVDGQNVGSEQLQGAIIPQTDAGDNGRIGHYLDTAVPGYEGGYWSGHLQGMCQYDTVLSPAQITKHYESIRKTRHYLSPAATPSMGNSAYEQYVLNELAPTGYWQMGGVEQGSNTDPGIDRTANNNDGTAFGSIQQGLSPLANTGRSALFIPKSTSDTAYIELPASTTITGLSNYTIMASAAPLSYAEAWQTGVIITIGDFATSGHQGFRLSLLNSGGFASLSIRYYPTSGGAFTFTSLPSNIPFVNDGSVSYHVAVTLNRTTDEVEFYLDGVSIDSQTLPNGELKAISASAKSYIGASGSTGTFNESSWNGIIDEISIHDAILTPEQIAASYSLRYALGVSNLDANITRWSMDDVLGSTSLASPIHQYTFDNVLVGVVQDEVGSFNLGGTNNPTYTSGYFNNALTLNGTNQYLEATGSYTNWALQTFSLSIWFKPNLDEPPFSENILTCYVDDIVSPGNEDFGWNLFHSSSGEGNVAFQTYDGTDGGVIDTLSVGASQRVVKAGEWVHICVTRNASGKIRLYFNGSLGAEKDVGGSIVYDALCEATVGARWRNGTYAGFIDGQIDQL